MRAAVTALIEIGVSLWNTHMFWLKRPLTVSVNGNLVMDLKSLTTSRVPTISRTLSASTMSTVRRISPTIWGSRAYDGAFPFQMKLSSGNPPKSTLGLRLDGPHPRVTFQCIPQHFLFLQRFSHHIDDGRTIAFLQSFTITIINGI